MAGAEEGGAGLGGRVHIRVSKLNQSKRAAAILLQFPACARILYSLREFDDRINNQRLIAELAPGEDLFLLPAGKDVKPREFDKFDFRLCIRLLCSRSKGGLPFPENVQLVCVP